MTSVKCFFFFFFRYPPRKTTAGKEEKGGGGGEEDEFLRLQLHEQFVGVTNIHHDVFQAPESFFEDASEYNDQLTFDDMNLSRPILKVRALFWEQLHLEF